MKLNIKVKNPNGLPGMVWMFMEGSNMETGPMLPLSPLAPGLPGGPGGPWVASNVKLLHNQK